MLDKDQANENDAYQKAAEFLRRIDARRGQSGFVPQPLGVKTTETASRLPPLTEMPRGNVGGQQPVGIGGGGGTQTMYFIDGGVLYTGDFTVTNVTAV